MTSFIDNLNKISQGSVLSEKEMESSMTLIMQGEVEDVDIAAFLTQLADRGETVEEITGAAKVLRKMVTPIQAPPNAVDCCGTGGDGASTYNISTAVALVCAGSGVPVAKHGNRASSSKSGAADVLESLGVNLNASLPVLEQALEKIGFCFLMAPRHHQAMKHVSAVRKKLGFRTIFNLLGPLANPANTQYQLIGVYDPQWLRPMAEVLRNLGTKAAWIVHGEDGLDEITITAKTQIAILSPDGTMTEKMLSPEDFGLPTSAIEALKGGDAQENAIALTQLLAGKPSAYRDIVLANSAAVLHLQGKASSLLEGVDLAARTIDSGKAKQILTTYIEMTNERS